MSEGIEWKELGTVKVTFDDNTYKLGRPKMRQFRYFTDKLEAASREITDQLNKLMNEIKQAEQRFEDDETTPEARQELDRLTAEVKELNAVKFYDRTTPILIEMFDQLGDSLPGKPKGDKWKYEDWDTDDWPAWLAADSSVPGEILKHWRNHPKVSGPPPPT